MIIARKTLFPKKISSLKGIHNACLRANINWYLLHASNETINIVCYLKILSINGTVGTMSVSSRYYYK